MCRPSQTPHLTMSSAQISCQKRQCPLILPSAWPSKKQPWAPVSEVQAPAERHYNGFCKSLQASLRPRVTRSFFLALVLDSILVKWRNKKSAALLAWACQAPSLPLVLCCLALSQPCLTNIRRIPNGFKLSLIGVRFLLLRCLFRSTPVLCLFDQES